MVYVNYHYDLTEEQMQEIVRRVQADLLKIALLEAFIRDSRLTFGEELAKLTAIR